MVSLKNKHYKTAIVQSIKPPKLTEEEKAEAVKKSNVEKMEAYLNQLRQEQIDGRNATDMDQLYLELKSQVNNDLLVEVTARLGISCVVTAITVGAKSKK